MHQPIVGVEKIRNDLKAKRQLLFANFSKNPSDTRLALEIRLLDDRISDLLYPANRAFSYYNLLFPFAD